MSMLLLITIIPLTALAEGEDPASQLQNGNLFLSGATDPANPVDPANPADLAEQSPQSTDPISDQVNMGNMLLFAGGGAEGLEVVDDGNDDPGLDGEDPYLDEDYVPEDEPAETVTGQGKITGVDVKVRAGSSTSHEVTFILPYDTVVNISGQDGSWYKVSFGVVEGYVHKDYVFLMSPEGNNGTIMQDGVNLRAGSTIESEAVAQLVAGRGVQVIDYEQGWYKIVTEGQTGYVRKDYIMVSSAFTGEISVRVLKKGMSGEQIKKMQNALKSRNYFIGEATGDFGSATEKALKDFQKAAKLAADGIAGESTLAMLYDTSNGIKKTIAEKSDVRGRVTLTEWDKVNKIIARGKTYKVIDVRTGISWTERRMGGWFHSDSEPLTASDTAQLKRAYGGKWAWDRRAVWVVYGKYIFAASMNGMPHLGHTLNNNFPGHHCIHFYKSKVHETSRQCPRHQSKVMEAYNAGK